MQNPRRNAKLPQMALYEARFLTHGNEVFGREQFEAEHDDAARDYTNRVLRTPVGKGHEIWHGDRLVHREIYR
jgi:hypothetical protein